MTKDEALEQPKLTDEKGRPMTYCGGLEQPQPRLFLDLSNSHGNHPVEQPAWQGLTDDEIDEIYANTEPDSKMDTYYIVLSRAIEQALKEKNT